MKNRFSKDVGFVIAHDKFMVWRVTEAQSDEVVFRSRTYAECFAFILQKAER